MPPTKKFFPDKSFKRKPYTKKGKSMIKQMAKTAINAAADYATGGVAGAVASAVDAMTQTKGRRGRVGDGKSKGKFSKTRRVRKAMKKNNQYTDKAFLAKGIQVGIERRFVMQEPGAPTPENRYESLIIGHCSLPLRQTFDNAMKALLKYLCTKLGVNIRDFQISMINDGFVVGDKVYLTYYVDQLSLTQVTNEYTVGTGFTYETFAANMATDIRGNPNGVQWQNVRWNNVGFIPSSGSRHQGLIINLETVKFHIKSRSSLKIQNRTTNIAGDAEVEEDDIDRVPLKGYKLDCKGNNLLHKITRRVLTPISQDFYFMEKFARGQNLVSIGNTLVSTTSTWVTVSEPLKASNYVNCKYHGKVSLDPGEIKTSYLKEYNVYSFSGFFRLMFWTGQAQNNNSPWVPTYNPKAGRFSAVHLEKQIGRSTSSVLIAAEIDFKQSIICQGYVDNYTAPQLMQADDAVQ